LEAEIDINKLKTQNRYINTV